MAPLDDSILKIDILPYGITIQIFGQAKVFCPMNLAYRAYTWLAHSSQSSVQHQNHISNAFRDFQDLRVLWGLADHKRAWAMSE